MLELVQLSEFGAHLPWQLSGGMQQRVAIARALANRPDLIIADEPTGQLDAETGLAVMELLRAVVRSEGVTALVATHDSQLLALADRVLGQVLDIVEGGRSGTDPAGLGTAALTKEIGVEPGERAVATSVTVTWELGR